MIKLKKLIKESDIPIYLDRHGSFPNRPKEVRFTGKTGEEDYNQHMGFDASLPDDFKMPIKQREKVRELLRQGYIISGYSKVINFPENQREISMMFKKEYRTEYVDILPNGKIS